MFKTLHKSLLTASLLAGALSVNAQAVLFEEQFNTTPKWAQQGYQEKIGCETGQGFPTTNKITFTPGNTINVSETYTGVPVEYTISNGAIDPVCGSKSTSSELTPGIVDLNKSTGPWTSGSSLTIRIMANITTVDLGISATGSSGRYVRVAKSTDGIVWDTILSANETRSGTQGAMTTAGSKYELLPVNATNPYIRVFGNENYLRVHYIIARGTVSGLENSLFENGATLAVSGNTITLTSPKNGTAQLINVNGTSVDQKEVNNEASFTNLQSGLYIVKLVVNNQVSVKKVMVQ